MLLEKREKKGTIRRIWRSRLSRRVIARFRWNFEGSRNLIRAHTAEFREGNDARSREIEGRPIEKKIVDIRIRTRVLRMGRARRTTFLERKFIENYFTVHLRAIYSLSSENFLRDRDTPTLWNLFSRVRYFPSRHFSTSKNMILSLT